MNPAETPLRIRTGILSTTLAATGALLLAAAVPTGVGAQVLPEEEPRMTEDPDVRRITLDQAVEVALRISPALRQARADINQARSQRTGAIGSFLPNVDMGYSFSDASTGRLDPTGQNIVTTSWTTSLSGNIQILDGGRRFHQLTSSRKTLAARRASYDEQRYQTQLNVKTAFFDAVAARELVQVELDRVERQLDQLDFVRQQVQLGQATSADSLQSRVDLNDARLALLNARNNARAAQFALAEAMGVEERIAPALEASLEPDTLRRDREELMRIAQEQSPRIRSARRSADAAEASVETQKSGYFPTLAFQGGFDWQDADFPPKDRSWSFRLTGNVPIFDGLQRETGVAQAQAQATSARAQERIAELAVRSDVDDAYSQIQTALSGLRLAEESVELSRENLRVNQQRYRFGTATILDLQQAQINLEQAQVDVIQRQFDYQVGIARLESLLGTELGGLTGAGGDGGAAAASADFSAPESPESDGTLGAESSINTGG